MNEEIVLLPNGDFKVKTPAYGPLPGVEPPRAQTLEEVQESWNKAKNIRPTPRKRD